MSEKQAASLNNHLQQYYNNISDILLVLCIQAKFVLRQDVSSSASESVLSVRGS